MPRTVAALYDTRPEAEVARARLISELRAQSPRIIGKDTAAAVDGLRISRAAAETYRNALRRGGHLVVAQVPSGAPAKEIIELLEHAIGAAADDGGDHIWGDGEQGVQVKLADAIAVDQSPEAPFSELPTAAAAAPAKAVEGARLPLAEDQLEIAEPEAEGGAARLHAFTRETPVEEQVTLDEEAIEVQRRSRERQLADSDVEDGGLFRDRVIEIAEMREEPVITKTPVVREELIIRKRVTQRTQTIRETLRQTVVEVEDLPASRDGAPMFVGEEE